MGTFYTNGATKADIVDQILKGLHNHLVDYCMKSEGGEEILWTVTKGEHDGETYQLISCYLLREAPCGWGYKPLDETMGPCYYSVPREWLDKYECHLLKEHKHFLKHSEAWRNKVRAQNP